MLAAELRGLRRRQIREGGNGMPGWAGLIPDDDIEAVIAYLRRVQAGG